MSSQADHGGLLRVSEAAWLAHVNDNTVREWIDKDESVSLSAEQRITWLDLDRLCRTVSRSRRPPLPLAALYMTPADVEDLFLYRRTGKDQVRDKGDAGQDGKRAQLLRRAMRELLDDALHQRSATAAAERALRLLLDEDEEASQLRRDPSPG